MKRLLAFGILLVSITFATNCLYKCTIECNPRQNRIAGYQLQEMIRARDSTRYYDTVGVFYYTHDTLIFEEKPYKEYE